MPVKQVEKGDNKAVDSTGKAPAPEGRSYKKDVKGVKEVCKDCDDVLDILKVKEGKKDIKAPKFDPNKLGPTEAK